MLDYRESAEYFYDCIIDLTSFFGVRVPVDIGRYINQLKYSFEIDYPVDGVIQRCVCFTDFRKIKKVWPPSVDRLIETADFLVGISKQDRRGLIYKGEILRARTFIRVDKSGSISALPYSTSGSTETLITFHIVYYDPSFFPQKVPP